MKKIILEYKQVFSPITTFYAAICAERTFGNHVQWGRRGNGKFYVVGTRGFFGYVAYACCLFQSKMKINDKSQTNQLKMKKSDRTLSTFDMLKIFALWWMWLGGSIVCPKNKSRNSSSVVLNRMFSWGNEFENNRDLGWCDPWSPEYLFTYRDILEISDRIEKVKP